MPLTPFVGLSVLIHLSIIAWHKLVTPLLRVKVRSAGKASTQVEHYFSLLIIFVVFSVVVTSASLLLRASVEDSHSTVHFVGAVSGRVSSKLAHWDQVFALASHASVSQKKVEAVPENCQYPNTLVGFLEAIGYDSSFNARAAYAAEFGVASYSGTAGENRRLLSALEAKMGQLPSVGAATCSVLSRFDYYQKSA